MISQEHYSESKVKGAGILYVPFKRKFVVLYLASHLYLRNLKKYNIGNLFDSYYGSSVM
jgi:hypothetical protein